MRTRPGGGSPMRPRLLRKQDENVCLGRYPRMTESAPSRSASGGPQTDHPAWLRWLPGLHTLLRYEPTWLPHDLVAGLVLATMLVPVGIAYAVASGLPGMYGLFASVILL